MSSKSIFFFVLVFFMRIFINLDSNLFNIILLEIVWDILIILIIFKGWLILFVLLEIVIFWGLIIYFLIVNRFFNFGFDFLNILFFYFFLILIIKG